MLTVEGEVGLMKTDFNEFVSWEESLSSEDYKRSLTANLVLEATRRRIQLGLSQQDLAARMGTTQSAISRFENLGRQPSIVFLERLAKALDVRFGATLNGDFMYNVPSRLHAFLESAAKEKDTTIRSYLHQSLTGYLDGTAWRTWNLFRLSQVGSADLHSESDAHETLIADWNSPIVINRDNDSLESNEELPQAVGI
jgi:transcriptional regulator with XRE-family HTH domain